MALRQPQPRATRTGVSQNDARGNSAARVSAYGKMRNRKKHGARSASGTKGAKKRGRQSSATQANVFRDAHARTNAAFGMDNKDEIEVAKVGYLVNKSNNKLSYEESMALIGQRGNKLEDITEQELEDLEAYQEEGGAARSQDSDAKEFRETVHETKVPIYGTLRLP